MDKKNRAQLLRHGVQLAAFLFTPALFATVFAAPGTLVSAIAGGTFTLSGMAAPLLTLAVVLLITALWGRVFCGWLCAFGAMGDLLGALARKLRIRQLRLSDKADRALRAVKYAVLAFVAVAVWALALPVEASWSPWSAFGMLTSWNPSVMRAALSTVGFALLLGVVLASLFVERFFCRCLCPLGALLAPVSKLRLFRVERKAAGCSGCSACRYACPMHVAVESGEAASSGECVACLRCTGACHADCLDAKASPALAGATVAAAMAGLVLLGGSATVPAAQADDPAPVELNQHIERLPHGGENFQLPSGENEQGFHRHRHGEDFSSEFGTGEAPQRRSDGRNATESVPQTPTGDSGEATEPNAPAESPTASAFTDGVYTGTGTGYRGDTTVRVTVSGGKITDVEVLFYRDDRNFFERAKGVIQSILLKQSVEVDTVSGATYSSRGIIAAVADALNIEYTAAQNAVHGMHGI